MSRALKKPIPSINVEPVDFHSMIQNSVALSQNVDQEKEYLMVRAPNAIEWITGERWLNQPSLFGWWGGYRLVKEFFELRCPVCNRSSGVPADPWGLSREVLESEVLLVWSNRDEDDVCPKCRTTRSDFIDQGLFKGYRNMHVLAGQRSGKSTTLAQLGTYMEHVLLVIGWTHPNGLRGYFGNIGSAANITFVASNSEQAQDTIWGGYTAFRRDSPWFRRYVPWIKLQEKLQETPKGMRPWEYVENAMEIRHENIGLIIDAKNSNSNGIAGRKRIAAIVDEICRMEQTDGPRGAQAIYTTMFSSTKDTCALADRYGLLPWMGMTASISSPMSSDDYGMTLYNKAHSIPRMYSRMIPTWEFNPHLPKSAFEEALKTDYVTIMRNFGCVVPGALNPFVDRPDDFLQAVVNPDLKPTATFEMYEFDDPKEEARTYLGVKLDRAELILQGVPRYIAVDAGKNFDAFSVACAHADYDEFGNIITVFDWCIRLLTRSRNQEVFFESVYELIKELKRNFTIARVEFDHWNSFPIIQRLRYDLGLFAEESETRPEAFLRFLRDGYSGRIQMLPPEEDDDGLEPPQKSAQGATLYELLKLERDPKNDKVYNPRKGLRRGFDSDDSARVAVHVHRLVQEQGYVEKQDDMSRTARRKRAEHAISTWNSEGRGFIFNPSRLTNGKGRGW